MYRALYTAASGMIAQQLNIENISNNLANMHTTGFKENRLNFDDLMYAQMQQPEQENAYQVGTGVRSNESTTIFTAGTAKETGNILDVAIQGNGFFEVTDRNGNTAYSRDGSFTIADGYLSTKGGLKTNIQVPENTSDITVKPDGTVWGYQNKELKQIGNLKMVSFLNPGGLNREGNNIFRESNSSGTKTYGKAGEQNIGTLMPGYLEMSNVNIVSQMTAIMSAQRAFEMSSKAVQSADEMQRLANQMQKG